MFSFIAHRAVARGLAGQDERAADEAVGDDPFFELDAAIPWRTRARRCGRESGIGMTKSAVDRRLAGELPAHRLADAGARSARRSCWRGWRSRRARTRTCASSAAGSSKRRLLMPLSSMRTISPGSISRTYSASIASNAHVSLATHQCPSGVLPEHQRANAPRVADGLDAVGEQEQQADTRPAGASARAAAGRASRRGVGLASRWTMISVSVVLWKMWPCCSYSCAEQRGVDQVAVVGDRDRAHARYCRSSGWALQSLLRAGGASSGRARWRRGRRVLRAASAA